MKILCNLVILLALAACNGAEPLLPDGAACTVNGQCDSGLCVTQFTDGVTISGGLCSRECEWLGTTSSCPTTEDGVAEVCLQYIPTGEKWCFESCSSDEECRTEEGWECSIFLNTCIPPL